MEPEEVRRIWFHVEHKAQGGPPLDSGTNAILCNPRISSAMTMAMSIHGTRLERWSIFHGDGMVMVVFLQRWNGDGFENF